MNLEIIFKELSINKESSIEDINEAIKNLGMEDIGVSRTLIESILREKNMIISTFNLNTADRSRY